MEEIDLDALRVNICDKSVQQMIDKFNRLGCTSFRYNDNIYLIPHSGGELPTVVPMKLNFYQQEVTA